jgi:hypothetical protein
MKKRPGERLSRCQAAAAVRRPAAQRRAAVRRPVATAVWPPLPTAVLRPVPAQPALAQPALVRRRMAWTGKTPAEPEPPRRGSTSAAEQPDRRPASSGQSTCRPKRRPRPIAHARTPGGSSLDRRAGCRTCFGFLLGVLRDRSSSRIPQLVCLGPWMEPRHRALCKACATQRTANKPSTTGRASTHARHRATAATGNSTHAPRWCWRRSKIVARVPLQQQRIGCVIRAAGRAFATDDSPNPHNQRRTRRRHPDGEAPATKGAAAGAAPPAAPAATSPNHSGWLCPFRPPPPLACRPRGAGAPPRAGESRSTRRSRSRDRGSRE